MRIDYKLIDLQAETNIQQQEAYVELLESRLHWKVVYKADIPNIAGDYESGVKNAKKHYEIWIEKSAVKAIGLSFLFRSNRWQVFIDATGIESTIDMYFVREKEAASVADKIQNWIISK